MSATGVMIESGDRGNTDPNPQEIEVKQAMARSAKRVVLLAGRPLEVWRELANGSVALAAR